MKCICGYEQGMAWVGEDPSEEEYVEVNPKGEKFIKVNGNFTINSEMQWDGKTIKEVKL